MSDFESDLESDFDSEIAKVLNKETKRSNFLEDLDNEERFFDDKKTDFMIDDCHKALELT